MSITTKSNIGYMRTSYIILVFTIVPKITRGYFWMGSKSVIIFYLFHGFS